MINKIKNNNGSALFLTIIIMSGVILVSLSAANIVLLGIKMGGTLKKSTKAYFAAEAGAERVLWAINTGKFNFTSCLTDMCVDFDDLSGFAVCKNCGVDTEKTFSDVKYEVQYKGIIGLRRHFKSFGNYQDDVKRAVEVSYDYLE